MPSISREFGRLYYRVNDDHPETVVLLHEYFGTGTSWNSQRSMLISRFRVITPDLRGHGRSPVTSGRISVADIASDILAILDHHRITRAHLVGCSLGALAALTVARLTPGRVASLVVSSIPDGSHPDVWDYAHRYINEVFPRTEESLSRIHGGDDPAYARNVLLHNFEADLRERPGDLVEAIARGHEVDVPTLLVSGDKDPVFPPARAVELHHRMPNSQLAVIPGAQHLPHQEMPHLFNLLLTDHLLGVLASRADTEATDPC